MPRVNFGVCRRIRGEMRIRHAHIRMEPGVTSDDIHAAVREVAEDMAPGWTLMGWSTDMGPCRCPNEKAWNSLSFRCDRCNRTARKPDATEVVAS